MIKQNFLHSIAINIGGIEFEKHILNPKFSHYKDQSLRRLIKANLEITTLSPHFPLLQNSNST